MTSKLLTLTPSGCLRLIFATRKRYAPRCAGLIRGGFLRASLDLKTLNVKNNPVPTLPLQAAPKVQGLGGRQRRGRSPATGVRVRERSEEGVQPPADWGQQDRVSDRYHPACGGTCFVVVFHRSLMQTRSENQRSIAF